MLGIAMRRRAARKTDADEESLIDFRLALGGVASRSAGCYLAEPATVGRSERPIRSNQSPNDRCFLHRGDDRDILQRTQRPERRSLRVKGRVHVKQAGLDRAACLHRVAALGASVRPCRHAEASRHSTNCATDQTGQPMHLLGKLPQSPRYPAFL